MTETMSESLLPNEHDDRLASVKIERALANALISDLQDRIAALEAEVTWWRGGCEEDTTDE